MKTEIKSKSDLENLAKRAASSSHALATLSTEDKNRALKSMAKALFHHQKFILAENTKDLRLAKKKELQPSLIARLSLDEKKIAQMAESLLDIARLPDPVGQLLETRKRPNGLVIKKVRVPIGVILIIYESRPNVTADCMALCLKSGNSVILKGGSEALYSNTAIYQTLKNAAVAAGIPNGAFELVDTTDRGAVGLLLKLDQYIQLVIPRGGESLIRHVAKNSKIPVLKHFKGVCHIYVDKTADKNKAAAIVINAKVQNPGVCNAAEALLVHESIAKEFLPAMAASLREKGVELRGCAKTRSLVSWTKKATEKDWGREYLDLILAVRVVKNISEAIAHIQKYGSGHSDAIITESSENAKTFSKRIDSSCVMVNASTRFNDGGQFGMGAEMGISTDKLHARGPVGLNELTSYKYIVMGNGQIRK